MGSHTMCAYLAGKSMPSFRKTAISQLPFGRYWLTLLLFSGMALLHCFTQNLELFSVDKIAIQHGEWWRLVSGHFVHSDNNHLIWNIVAFAMLGAMLEQHSRKLFIQSIVVG